MYKNDLKNDLSDLQDRLDKKLQQAVNNLEESDKIAADTLRKNQYSVFYNDPLATLKEGFIYFVGLNPGVDGNEESYQKQKFENIKRGYCAYLDEDWGKKGNIHKERIIDLLKFIISRKNLDIGVRDIFSTNVYFFRSKGIKQLKKYNLKNIDCWDYQKEFLEVIKPNIIICNGNAKTLSAFKIFVSGLGFEEKSKPVYGKFFLKYSNKIIDEKKVVIIGLPHMSRVAPDHLYNLLEQIL